MLTESEIKVIHFRIKDVYMCVYLDNLKKILPLVELKTIPESPNYLVGMMNLHGKSIPVIDLSIRLGMDRTSVYTIDVPMLLCHHHSTMTAFIVDEVVSLSNISKSSIQVYNDFNQKESSFEGVIIENNSPSLLLNIANLIPTDFTEMS